MTAWRAGRASDQAGFNLFAPTWRGENGNPGTYELAYGEVEDVVAALSFVTQHPAVDPARVYVFGHSARGMISSLLAAVPNLPVKETASADGLYTPQAIVLFEGVPFDTSDPTEAALRSRVQIIDVPGDHMQSLRPAVLAYRERITGTAGAQ